MHGTRDLALSDPRFLSLRVNVGGGVVEYL